MNEDIDKKILEDIKFILDRQINEFNEKVSNEKDISTTLLRGHLLIEYYLDNLIILLFDKNINLHNLGFYGKIKKIQEKKYFSDDVFYCLKNINDIRNNLAHRLDFKISFSEIDSIGFNLGKKYIIEKFSKSGEDKNKLLLYVIEEIVRAVFTPLFIEIMQEKMKELDNKKEYNDAANALLNSDKKEEQKELELKENKKLP